MEEKFEAIQHTWRTKRRLLRRYPEQEAISSGKSRAPKGIQPNVKTFGVKVLVSTKYY